jgi:hypothetical protein
MRIVLWEKQMKTTRAAVWGVVLAVATVIGTGVLVAQSQAPKQQAEQKAPEVFCDGLSTGQLCLSNAPKVLKLDDAQKQRWTEAARQYNKGVDAATKQFLEQSKPILSPEQFATMQKWFEMGLNPVLNQMLAAHSSSK